MTPHTDQRETIGSNAQIPPGDRAEEAIVRALICLAPQTAQKETKHFLQQTKRLPVPEIYNRVLRLNRLTNKELLHFITVMDGHPYTDGSGTHYPGLTLNDLVGLKFPDQGKYMTQIAIGYFSIVSKVYARLTPEHRLELFYRYLFLFKGLLCTDMLLYQSFAQLLRKDFLEIFLHRQLYLDFVFLKEFLVDFRGVGARLAKIGYEVPQMRELVFQLLRSDTAAPSNWLLQRWRVTNPYTCAELFYLFDCVYYMCDLAAPSLGRRGDILSCLLDDLRSHGCRMPGETAAGDTHSPPANAQYCVNRGECALIAKHIEGSIAAKKAYADAIAAFNTSMVMGALSVRELRISPLTDLKMLGELICKEKNAVMLEEFIRSFSFARIDILEALRGLLGSFHLIGESQIIERVIIKFVEVYLEQNGIPAKSESEDFRAYRSLSYSFVALNTMLHNPSVDKRPAFEEYCRLVGYRDGFIIGKDVLKSYYTSIKDGEIKLPTSWEDSYDMYLLSIKLAHGDLTLANAAETGGLSDSHALREDGVEVSELPLCSECIVSAYAHMFSQSYSDYFYMEPAPFMKACIILGNPEIYGEYIKKHAGNTAKGLGAYKLYAEVYPLDYATARVLVELVLKIERPRSSVFDDLKSLFSVSKTELNSTGTEFNVSQYVLSSFVKPFSSLCEIKFQSETICTHNLKAITASAGPASAMPPILGHLLLKIIENNTDVVADLSYLDGPVVQSVLHACPQLVNAVSDVEKLRFLNRKAALSAEDYALFKSIHSDGPDAFELFCKLQNSYAGFNEAISIKPKGTVSDDDLQHYSTIGGFCIFEKYSQSLAQPKNVVHFMMTSQTLLNSKIAAEIHKPNCPLNGLKNESLDMFIYLIYKCHAGPASLAAYAKDVLKSLSISLILFVRIIRRVRPVLPEINVDFRNDVMRILIKRLTLYTKTQVACCDQHPHPDMAELQALFGELISAGLISKDELDSAVPALHAEIVEL